MLAIYCLCGAHCRRVLVEMGRGLNCAAPIPHPPSNHPAFQRWVVALTAKGRLYDWGRTPTRFAGATPALLECVALATWGGGWTRATECLA